MNRTTHCLAVLAASCMFAGASYAQMDTTGKQAEDPNRTVTPADHPTGSMNNMSSDSGMKMSDMKGAPKDNAEAIKMYGSDMQTGPDKLFVYMAGIGNRTEIEAAKAAQSKTDSDEVKKVAKSIEEDHTKAQSMLEPIAQKLGVEWPAQLPPEKQAHMQMMAMMPTADFNKMYVKHMLVDHAKDIAEFKETAATAKSEDVKMYAEQTLPDLIKHNKELNEAAKSLGLPSTMGMMGGMKHDMDNK